MNKNTHKRWNVDLVVATLSIGLLGSVIVYSMSVIQWLCDKAWDGIQISELPLHKYSYCFRYVALHSGYLFGGLRVVIIMGAVICMVFGRRNPGLYTAVFIACSLALLLLVGIVVVVAVNEIPLLKGPLQT